MSLLNRGPAARFPPFGRVSLALPLRSVAARTACPAARFAHRLCCTTRSRRASKRPTNHRPRSATNSKNGPNRARDRAQTPGGERSATSPGSTVDLDAGPFRVLRWYSCYYQSDIAKGDAGHAQPATAHHGVRREPAGGHAAVSGRFASPRKKGGGGPGAVAACARRKPASGGARQASAGRFKFFRHYGERLSCRAAARQRIGWD